ncbi:MAG: hypothetical protein IT303_14800 [Dehalococcoidia bacterium]|nr:hypothetical protein [Dehalococcoidia bacterium]
MAANFSAAAPTEPEKSGAYLHDRSRIPSPPADDWKSIAKPYGGLAIGLVLAFVLVGLAFETRDTWMAHRDWVVPVTTPLLAIGGVALGHLIWRQQWDLFFTGFLILVALIGLVASNIWRGELVEGEDTGRDVLAIISGITLGLLVVYSVVAVVICEWKRATKPPEPAA